MRRAQRADAAERRRVAQRTAGVGAERGVDQAGGDRDGAAAAGSARNPVAIPRVAAGAPPLVLGGGAEAQLLEVGLRDDHGPGRAQAPHGGRVGGRRCGMRRGEAVGRGGAGDVGVVLDGERPAGQRRGRVDRGRLRERLAADEQAGAQVTVERVDPRQAGAGAGDRRAVGGHHAASPKAPARASASIASASQPSSSRSSSSRCSPSSGARRGSGAGHQARPAVRT